MNENETAEQQEAEDTAEQDSPTAEQNTLDDQEDDSGENLDETPDSDEVEDAQAASQDRNWKEVREQLQKLKQENERLKGEEPTPRRAVRTQLDNLYLTPDENVALSKDELKAELKYPDLESRNPFSAAVYGEYRMALDEYNLKKSLGQPTRLPSAYEIATRVKQDIDTVYGKADKSVADKVKRAEAEGAKKAKKAKEGREATVEAEGRSSRARAARTSAELEKLQDDSRHGNLDAVAERISRSKL